MQILSVKGYSIQPRCVPNALFELRGGSLVCLVVAGAGHQLQLQLQGGQRRAQFVGSVGDEGALAVEGQLQVRQQ